jgi:uncharacterized delta-60 repeat protein
MNILRLLFPLVLLSEASAFALPGDLDVTFAGGTGKVVIGDVATADSNVGVAAQGDGKIVTVGWSMFDGQFDVALRRFLPDGSLDLGFGTNGIAAIDATGTDDLGATVHILPDGRLLVAGYAFSGGKLVILLVRCLPNGAVDPSFGNGTGHILYPVGTGNAFAYRSALQPDGKLVVVGKCTGPGPDDDAMVLRFLPTGAIDPDFGGTTTGQLDLVGSSDFGRAVALQPDGKILIAGDTRTSPNSKDGLIFRLNPDGTRDADFGIGGKLVLPLTAQDDAFRAILVQPDGKIVAAGQADGGVSDSKLAIVRLLPGGTTDLTFGTNGVVLENFDSTPDQAQAIVRQADGHFIVGGSSGIAALLARYDANGSPDVSFGTDGLVRTLLTVDGALIYALALTSDGKIVAAGEQTASSDSDSFTLRYVLEDPIPDGAIGGQAYNPANGHYYYSIIVNSWTAAEAVAQKLGGHLVTLNDAAEETFVRSTFGSSTPPWIGLNDAAKEGEFVWASGEPVGYTNWVGGQPSGEVGQNYVRLVSGGWDDDVLTVTNGIAIAEVPGPESPVSSTGQVPGEDLGTTFVEFGSPAIDGGNVGGLATIKKQNGQIETVLYGVPDGKVIARTGGPAPDGGTFVTLGDPVFAGEGLGFLGTQIVPPPLAVSDKPTRAVLPAGRRLQALYSRLSVAAGTRSLASVGGNAAQTGGRYARFSGFGLPRGRAGMMFTAFLRRGSGVTPANDFGVWRERGSGGDPDFLFGHGRSFFDNIPSERGGSPTDVIKKVQVIIPVDMASDQRRSFAPDGGVMAAATFTDGRQAIVSVSGEGEREIVMDSTAEVPDLPEAEFQAIEAPATANNRRFAFRATLRNGRGGIAARNNQAIFARLGNSLRQVQRRGQIYPRNDELRFASLGHPLLGQSGMIAFIAALGGPGVTPKNRQVIMQHRGGVSTPVARLGNPAPGTDDGVVYQRFQSMQVTDTEAGQIVFTGLLSGSGITPMNKQGLWSVDATGEVRLILRANQPLNVAGTTAQVRTFTSLQAPPITRGQGRSTDADGFVTAKVKLTDGRSGVLRIRLP